MRRGEIVAAVGVGVFVLACCGVLPVVAAFVGAAGLAALLGAGAAVLVAAGALGVLLVVVRRRRARHGSAVVRPGDEGSGGQRGRGLADGAARGGRVADRR